MKICILYSDTKIVENVINIDDPANFVPYKPNIEVSSRHDGEMGWQLVDGEWLTGIPTKDEVFYARGIRRKRDFKLKKSDKFMLPDFPITPEKRTEWETYRQNLRDITSQPNFPNNVVWPTEPE